MHKLAEICVRRPVFATVIVLSLVVVGWFAYQQLGVDRFPKVDFPTIVISTRLVGAAPEEIETDITDKIEEAVNTISGIDQLQSISSEGISQVTVQFVLEKDADVAAQEVRDRVNTVLRDLPLRTYGRVLTPQEFANVAISEKNGYVVRVGDVAHIEDSVAEPESIATVEGKPAVVMSIRKQSGTNTIEVVNSLKERLKTVEKDLPKGWTMQVVRDQSDYILAAVNAVKEHLILGSLFASLIVWFFLSSPKLKAAAALVFATLAVYFLLFGFHDLGRMVVPLRVAGVLVALGMLTYFFRRSRPTVISAVAIPRSIIATFAAMRYENFTLNVITLLALTLAVGIVIDDAVVVLEIIFRFMEEKKRTPREAAVEGTKEVGLAVMATSLSLIAVFLPVAFMAGIVGRFMHSFGVTMAIAIAVSLVVSFTLTPTMSSRSLRREDLHHGKSTREHGMYGLIERTYLRMLDWSLAHRWVIVTAMVLALISIVPLGMKVNKNFLPQDDESQFQITARAPEGSSLATTQTIMESIAARVRQIPEVATTVVTIGDDPQVTQNLGAVYVKLVPVNKRKRTQFDVMTDVRQQLLPQY